MTTIEHRLLSLQQKLEHLHTEVATLLAMSSTEQANTGNTDKPTEPKTNPLPGRHSAQSRKSSVGINRYRQLQSND